MTVGLIVSFVVVFSFTLMIIIHHRNEKKEDSAEKIRAVMNRILENYNK